MTRMTLSDESSGVTWRLGQRVVVEVAGVDVPRGRDRVSLARGAANRMTRAAWGIMNHVNTEARRMPRWEEHGSHQHDR